MGMKFGARRLTRTLASTLAVALGAVVAMLAWVQPGIAAPAVSGGQSVGFDVASAGDRLLATSGDRLAVCVQPSTGVALDQQAALSSVAAAITVAMQNPAWASSDLGRNAPALDFGCPSEALLLRPGARFDGSQITAYPPGAVVDQASSYALFVFVLPREQFASIFPSATAGGADRGARDQLRRGDCRAVSYGLYLPQDEAAAMPRPLAARSHARWALSSHHRRPRPQAHRPRAPILAQMAALPVVARAPAPSPTTRSRRSPQPSP